ncbi:lasso peptide biosynthesis B2 protein [Novosphingobium jiangmenense]|uniref:Lasso peptide biosynthesis B2 protein n=1 Tax=Novosphingobium jiangmenense TaxID=2791981 RepID=A0ABS0HLA6_9SPHN|nr:lasso peptide biosynthesis B2 protein [Novosphingobium jiangmenense]
MTYVVVARFLVRFIPFSWWRDSVGQMVEPRCALAPQATCLSVRSRQQAFSLVRQIDRACKYLPGTSRCLPRAVVLCWLLRGQSLTVLTVIAFSKVDRTGEDAYHAWVECGGEVLIGHCDRSTYQPIMVLCSDALAFAQSSPAATE